MSTKTAYLAFDYGASSGRLMLCCYDGHTIDLEEIYRFPNEPVWMNGHFYWDFPEIVSRDEDGVEKGSFFGCGDCGNRN
ncbi:MAG: hypothetical protein ACLR23_07720 [Clostridia bacterium]